MGHPCRPLPLTAAVSCKQPVEQVLPWHPVATGLADRALCSRCLTFTCSHAPSLLPHIHMLTRSFPVHCCRSVSHGVAPVSCLAMLPLPSCADARVPLALPHAPGLAPCPRPPMQGFCVSDGACPTCGGLATAVTPPLWQGGPAPRSWGLVRVQPLVGCAQ